MLKFINGKRWFKLNSVPINCNETITNIYKLLVKMFVLINESVYSRV